MNRSSLALLILFFGSGVVCGQSVTRLESPNLRAETETRVDRVAAARALTLLKRLDDDVIVYRSLGDFEANGRLAQVSFAKFANDLQAVTNEVEPMLSRMPQGRFKTAITNALDSYRDGAFWWQKIDQPRVVHVFSPYSYTHSQFIGFSLPGQRPLHSRDSLATGEWIFETR